MLPVPRQVRHRSGPRLSRETDPSRPPGTTHDKIPSPRATASQSSFNLLADLTRESNSTLSNGTVRWDSGSRHYDYRPACSARRLLRSSHVCFAREPADASELPPMFEPLIMKTVPGSTRWMAGESRVLRLRSEVRNLLYRIVISASKCKGQPDRFCSCGCECAYRSQARAHSSVSMPKFQCPAADSRSQGMKSAAVALRLFQRMVCSRNLAPASTPLTSPNLTDCNIGGWLNKSSHAFICTFDIPQMCSVDAFS